MDLEHPLFVNLTYAITSFSDYNGNALDRAVFADIAQFANRYGVSYPTTRSIAARIGRRREEVSKSVNRLKAKGFLTITKAKKGLDRHSRNVYHIAERFIRRRPDKRSKHFSASKWQRWCEIGRKRAITIKLKQKKTGTIRDTAAEMATRTIAASASPTPAQARKARQQRGGGFDALGDALRGMGLLGAPTATQPVVKDTYNTENRQRGDLLQQLRQHEAAAVMASQPIQAAPMSTAPAVPPIQQPPTQPTASEQRERKAQAFDELQPLRERLRRQATPDTTGDHSGAWQVVARDYARASRPAASSSPWPATTTQPVQLIQTIQQPATTPAVEQDAQATRDYWKRKLREHEAQQQAAAAMGEAR